MSKFVAAADFNRLHSNMHAIVHSRRESADVGESSTITITDIVSEGGEEGDQEGGHRVTQT